VNTKPISNVLGVCKCSRESHKSDIVASLFGDIPHSADYDFYDWTSFLAQEMNLINHYQCHLLNIASVLPVSTDTIPLLRSSDKHICLLQSLKVWSDITSKLKNDLS